MSTENGFPGRKPLLNLKNKLGLLFSLFPAVAKMTNLKRLDKLNFVYLFLVYYFSNRSLQIIRTGLHAYGI